MQFISPKSFAFFNTKKIKIVQTFFQFFNICRCGSDLKLYIRHPAILISNFYQNLNAGLYRMADDDNDIPLFQIQNCWFVSKCKNNIKLNHFFDKLRCRFR